MGPGKQGEEVVLKSGGAGMEGMNLKQSKGQGGAFLSSPPPLIGPRIWGRARMVMELDKRGGMRGIGPGGRAMGQRQCAWGGAGGCGHLARWGNGSGNKHGSWGRESSGWMQDRVRMWPGGSGGCKQGVRGCQRAWPHVCCCNLCALQGRCRRCVLIWQRHAQGGRRR